MPIYEYLCEACGTLTENMQKMTDPGPKKCPECGSKKIARMISRTSFQLKGGGWYADLYGSPKKEGEKQGTHGKPADAKAGADAPAAKDKPEAAPAGGAEKGGADAAAKPAAPAPKKDGGGKPEGGAGRKKARAR